MLRKYASCPLALSADTAAFGAAVAEGEAVKLALPAHSAPVPAADLRCSISA
jgi:hypothetical protein